MPLFQQSVLRKYISELNPATLSASWKTFQSHFHNPRMQHQIRRLKEEQYQEGFVRDLFVNVFGYTLNPQPDFNLTTEYKNEKDSKKADAAILKTDTVIAVIELKGTDTTDLSKIETQAFGYMHNQKGCTYVIISNFEKLRFYIQDATEYLEFNLFTIGKDEFDLLYLCLQADSLLGGIPFNVKQQSVTQEDAITKKLYSDYSIFKQELYQDLVIKNPQYDKLQLYKKSQKLLDRFLFILFAEDRILLPPNLIVKIVEEYKQIQKLRLQQTLYERFRVYFADLFAGNKDEDIFAYNGGLFEPDPLLDNLTISDNVLQQGVLALSQYDYNSEVDVNILGHIFEHSLNEIEQLQATVDNNIRDKSITRRKKEGVFYTPRYITKYIVENTLGALCREKKEVLQIVEQDYTPAIKKTKASEIQRKKLVHKLDNYRTWLLSLNICDPACGSGAFLNAALEFLVTEHNYIDELTNKLMGASIGFTWTPNDILEHNLFGVDINDEAVEIARLSLWLRTAQKGRKLSNLSGNIKTGNSLVDAREVAGDRAFVWQNEFKEVFEKGGFDVVIGNPPYVRVEFIDKESVDFFKKTFQSATGKFDLSSLFVEKAIQIVNPFGRISIISSYQFIYTSSGIGIRKFIMENSIPHFLLFSSAEQIFASATTYTGILSFLPGKSDTLSISKAMVESNDIMIVESILVDGKNFKNEKAIISNGNLIDKIKNIPGKKLGKEIGTAKTGVVTSSDEVFFLSESTIKDEKLENEIIYPIVGSDEIKRWFINTPSTYCLYPYKEENNKTTLLSLDYLQVTFPNVYTYLHKNKMLLTSRSQGRKDYSDSEKWYQLNRPREKWIYDSMKILYPGTVNKPTFSFDDKGQMFRNARSYAFVLNNSTDTGLYKFLLCILNSTLSHFIISNLCPPKSGGYFEMSTGLLDVFPFVIPNKKDPFIDNADIMISKNRELHIVRQSLLQFLEAKHSGVLISKKLAEWPSLSFKDFVKELEKQKIKFSVTEQAEWLPYFESEKGKVENLQHLINKTSKEIDMMIYQLYKLTEQEINIVEAALHTNAIAKI